MKPQIGALIYLVWVIALLPDLTRRWRVGHTLGWLVWWGGSLLLDPTWPLRWRYQIELFADARHHQSIATAASAFTVGQAAPLVLLAIAVAVVAWAWLRRDRLAAAGALMVAGLLLTPFAGFYDTLILWLALVVLAARHPRGALVVTLLSWMTVVLGKVGADRPLALTVSLLVPLLLLTTPPATLGRHRDRLQGKPL